MWNSRWSLRSLALVALLAATFAGPNPVRAQNQLQPKFNESSLQGLIVDYDGAENLIVANLSRPMDELFGATLEPVDDVLRSQLEIPAGQGVLVAAVRAGGPSAQVGLQANDIVLSVADKPVAGVEDLSKQLKAAGEATVPLKVLRGGKPVILQVRPSYRVTFGPAAAESKTEYFIGVSLDPVSDALRTQLGLPAGQGVVISDVIGGSPAEKAGVKKNDIALELGGKPVGTPEALAHQVQEDRDAPSTLKVMRGGKVLTIPVTAATRKVEAERAAEAYRLILGDLHVQLDNEQARQQLKITQPDLSRRLDQLEKEMKALREAVDQINENLKKGK